MFSGILITTHNEFHSHLPSLQLVSQLPAQASCIQASKEGHKGWLIQPGDNEDTTGGEASALSLSGLVEFCMELWKGYLVPPRSSPGSVVSILRPWDSISLSGLWGVGLLDEKRPHSQGSRDPFLSQSK